MRTFWKVFAITFLVFVIVFSGLAWSFDKYMRENNSSEPPVVVIDDGNNENNGVEQDKLMGLVKDSKRVNFVVLGLDGPRSDTMIFMSFDPKGKSLDAISIPRDTYLVRKGYNRADQKKINAAYGAHGAEGVKTVVSSLLFNVPVDYYVTLTYKGVADITNSIGGVPVYIPKKMEYDDEYQDPPLHIRFEPGDHVLKGEKSVEFLRYRQPNKGSGALDRYGDLGRVKAQQEFIKSAMQKVMGPKLPNAIGSAFKHVKTDIPLQTAMKHALSAIGLKVEDINISTLPGEPRRIKMGDFFFHDPKATRELLIKIYSNE
ncbi:MAG: LCP family protein [Natronincolaceae bacterium]|jgi:LCP family protein required for cell wall assembly|nr:LCP family protein [Bacillota bacterium]NLK90984.1 LCP family protein [Clostridiales bacterium]